ncbi:MAG: hypothetical protein OXE81_09850 [Gammaproteobacteria bacterium]|nr:hypothetical protein [Gammaproteobacteria bacterium]
MLIAAPVAAQTTITAPGLSGDAACGGGYLSEINSMVMGYQASAITNTNLPFSLSSITDWATLRSALGIADNPVSSIAITAEVINTRTGATVRTINLGTATSSQNASYATTNVTLAEKTPYVAIVYTDFAGHGESNPFSVRCFMTGGTYTIGNAGSSNFIMNLWNDAKRDAELSAECTLDGQLGDAGARTLQANANLTARFGGNEAHYNNTIKSVPNCENRCRERYPFSDSVSTGYRNTCNTQCAALSGLPSWADLLREEIAAIERTFDPGKCRAPEADQPQTNGCYSISPRTPLDVKNCLCGRSPKPSGLGCR